MMAGDQDSDLKDQPPQKTPTYISNGNFSTISCIDISLDNDEDFDKNDENDDKNYDDDNQNDDEDPEYDEDD